MGTVWRGMLAPLDVSTGDARRFLSSGISNRPLPLPLKWQRADTFGHDMSVVVGSCDEINYGTVAEAIENGWIDAKCIKPSKFAQDLMAVWGHGELFDVNPQTMPRLAEDVAEATLLLEQKVIGPSVDAGSAEAVVARKGSDDPLSDSDLDDLLWSDESSEGIDLEMLFTEYQIAAATLVAIPAFAECRPFELLPQTVTAAVRSSGWDEYPLAERDHPWDGVAAERRIADDAGIGGDSPDWGRYAKGFLYQDDSANPETKGAYGFLISDVVDGTWQIVPRGVFAVANVLSGGRGGTKIPQADQDAMKIVVDRLYARMADEFDDPAIVVPWAEESAALIARLTAATQSYDPTLFGDPKLPGITNVTITDEGEVFGHIADHGTCHVGIPGQCVTAPLSSRGYSDFHRYSVQGDDGNPIQVGRITVGHGGYVCTCRTCRGSNDDHACLSLTASGAIAHHDQLSTVAWVRAGEDEPNNAIWIHGVINPSASQADIASLARARVSGDWRPLGSQTELVEVLSLARERPGFPLPRVRIVDGRTFALTAAGAIRPMASERKIPEIDYDRLADAISRSLAQRLQLSPEVAPLGDTSSEPAEMPVETNEDHEVDADRTESDAVELLREIGEAATEASMAQARNLLVEIERII